MQYFIMGKKLCDSVIMDYIAVFNRMVNGCGKVED